MTFDREKFTEELRTATAGAKLYNGGPSVHYGTIPDAYAVNVTLFDNLNRTESGILYPTDETEVLVVQRGNGDGAIGSWSGISGYIDRPDVEDPLTHSVLGELAEEVGIGDELARTYDLRVGQRFSETRFGGQGDIHIIPVAIAPETRPEIRIDGTEVVDYKWLALGSLISSRRRTDLNFSNGYLENTLPNVLRAFDTDSSEPRQ